MYLSTLTIFMNTLFILYLSTKTGATTYLQILMVGIGKLFI